MVRRPGAPSVHRRRDRTASAQAPAPDQGRDGTAPTPRPADRCSAESGGEWVSIVCSSPQPSYDLWTEDQGLLVQRCYRFFEARIEQSCVIATLRRSYARGSCSRCRRIRTINRYGTKARSNQPLFVWVTCDRRVAEMPRLTLRTPPACRH